MPGSGEPVRSLVLARLCAVLSPSTNPRPAWKAQKGRSGQHHAAEGNCRESLHPTPCPGIQFRTLWELENASTLNTTPPLLSSLLGSLIKAQFIHAGSYFLSVKDRQILTKTGVCRNQQQRSCKCCSFPSSPAKIQTRESSKTSVDPSTDLVQCHSGALILVAGSLNSHFLPVTPRSSPVGHCFSDTSLNKEYLGKPQENPPDC